MRKEAIHKQLKLMILAFALIFIGSGIAAYVQTSGGAVKVSDIRIEAKDGSQLSALLYKPKSASDANPAPGVLATHGYINSRETQSGFAIELSKRGYVVLAIDQRGHGYSDAPTFANGFGAPTGLTYLRSLPFVDKTRIGLEGHSMGGWASRAATLMLPNDYRSIVLVGSSTAKLPFGDFRGSPTDPKNIAIVFSTYDEFAPLMWRTLPQDMAKSEDLKTLFGTEETVETEKLYGDISQGTARKLYQPATTHPGDHISPEAILNAVEWLDLTLDNASGIAPDSHTFLWKEIGTLIAFIGIVLLLFPVTKILLNTSLFRTSLIKHAEAFQPQKLWPLHATLATLIPVATYFLFYNIGTVIFPGSPTWPQNITNGIAIWALGNGLITIILGALTWFTAKISGSAFTYFGLSMKPLEILKTLILSIIVVGLLIILSHIIQSIFLVDFRYWVVALKPPSLAQLKMIFVYWPVFAIFFLLLSANFAGLLRNNDNNLMKACGINSIICALGFPGLLVIQYTSLFATGALLINEALMTIVALQFVPLLLIVACITTACYQWTGRAYLGGFVSSLFITWYIVAGQATHVA
ncbi:alpha/beta hydrolase family protein [Aurantivibrio plasticivorans]